MKTLIICIMAAVISTSNGSLLSLLLGGEEQNQRSEPQRFFHHHHHHHEVLHKSVIVADHHPLEISSGIHESVEVHPEHAHIYKIVYEHGGHGHHGHGPGYGYGYGHGPVYHHAAPHVVTEVVQPVLNKNFIHNTDEHVYHQHHVASGHDYYHGNGWD